MNKDKKLTTYHTMPTYILDLDEGWLYDLKQCKEFQYRTKKHKALHKKRETALLYIAQTIDQFRNLDKIHDAYVHVYIWFSEEEIKDYSHLYHRKIQL